MLYIYHSFDLSLSPSPPSLSFLTSPSLSAPRSSLPFYKEIPFKYSTEHKSLFSVICKLICIRLKLLRNFLQAYRCISISFPPTHSCYLTSLLSAWRLLLSTNFLLLLLLLFNENLPSFYSEFLICQLHALLISTRPK